MFADPPLDPSSEQARRLLEHELSKPKYGDRRNLVERFVDWVREWIDKLAGGVGGLDTRWIVLALAVLAVVIGLGLSRVRLRQGPRLAEDDELLDTRGLSADELRAAGARALADGDLADAYLQYFRALARRGVERTLVAERPGATAHEVSLELARAFPDHRPALHDASDTFDAVRYGGRLPDRTAVEAIRDLDRALSGTRPLRPATQTFEAVDP